jgi:small subunit ribosomal protein S20
LQWSAPVSGFCFQLSEFRKSAAGRFPPDRFMPNTASAKKRLRQSKVRRSHNRAIKSSLKTYTRKILTALDAGDVAGAEQAFNVAARRLDKAGSSNVIHKNTAARRKSRLQRRIVAAKQKQSGNA